MLNATKEVNHDKIREINWVITVSSENKQSKLTSKNQNWLNKTGLQPQVIQHSNIQY